jgi:DNA repair photolyase
MSGEESPSGTKATTVLYSAYVRSGALTMPARKRGTDAQQSLAIDATNRAPLVLPTIGEQKDIRYHASRARGLLNGPESTGMSYWSINPYVGCAFGCTYCYARYAHRYALDRALSASSTAQDLPDELRPSGPRLAALVGGEVVVIGTATDPYQPAERRFRITRRILETLAGHEGLSIVIITKSPLITRDVDLLARITERSALTIHLSLITMRRDLARLIEPRAPTPDSRVRALARLRAANVDVGINIMPVLPGITDNPSDLTDVVEQVAAGGATHVNACSLRLRATARARRPVRTVVRVESSPGIAVSRRTTPLFRENVRARGRAFRVAR